jgi:GTPase
MPHITWEAPYCGEGNSCYRLGTDDEGNSYIAIAGEEDHPLTDSREALRTLIREIKAGKADHLL